MVREASKRRWGRGGGSQVKPNQTKRKPDSQNLYACYRSQRVHCGAPTRVRGQACVIHSKYTRTNTSDSTDTENAGRQDMRQLGAVVLVASLALLISPESWLSHILELGLSYFLPANVSSISLRRGAARASVVVVPGFRLHADGSPSTLLAQRIVSASQFAVKNDVGAIIYSGGIPKGFPTSEAALMHAYTSRCLRRCDRPRRVRLEVSSRSTRENAVESLRISKQYAHRHRLDAMNVIVLTSRFHLPRTCRTFAKAASEMEDAHTHGWRRPLTLRIMCVAAQAHQRPTSPADGGTLCTSPESIPHREVTWLALRECFALLLYWVRGWI